MNAFTCTYAVRLATVNDVAEVQALAWRHCLSGASFLADRNKADAEIARVVNTSAALIICDRNLVIGSAGWVYNGPWYTSERLAQERWIFVIPEYRHTRAFAMLFGAMKAVTKNAGFELMVSTGSEEYLPILRKRALKVSEAFRV